jgi:hypothetical protein
MTAVGPIPACQGNDDLTLVVDKLVAVHMDLEPLCGTTAARLHIVATPQGIAEACDILHAAIADVRNIVRKSKD